MEVSFPVAFLAGLVSFITPCVLPLVPVYLSILSGTSFDELTGRGSSITAEERKVIHQRVIANAIAFIIGFSVIFIVVGVFAGVLGASLINAQNTYGPKITNWLLLIFGIVMVLLGLNMAGFWKPMFLNQEARFQLQKGKWGLVSSGLVGAAFAFGWTPCIGPILAPILALAAESGSQLKGALLLATYSLGLAIPFFLSALSVNGLIAFTNKMKHHFHTMEIIVGSLLIIIGILLAGLGGYGIGTNRDGLNLVRERMGWLDKYTIGLEESLSGQAIEDNSTETVVTPDGEFEVEVGDDLDGDGMPDEAGEPPVADGPDTGD